MNIFTISFSDALNYGAFLQCYALQHRLGHSKLLSIRRSVFSYVGKQKRQIHPFIWPIFIPIIFIKMVLKRNFSPLFRDWKKIKKIVVSQFTQCEDLLKKEAVVVVGSDQVWNPDFIPNQENLYFANFSKGNIYRISYAASLGKQKWPKDFEDKVLPFLKKFKAISVREETSVSYLKELGLDNVVCVCDPTILYEPCFYREHFRYKFISSEYTFVYRIREDVPEKLRAVFCDCVKDVFLQNKKTIVSVATWLQYIDCSKFVVTDSFHCVVFCLLFHKPFLVILNQSSRIEMNERFSSLLGKVNLLYRCLIGTENTDEVAHRLSVPIDWNEVDRYIDEIRRFSLNWLKNAMSF